MDEKIEKTKELIKLGKILSTQSRVTELQNDPDITDEQEDELQELEQELGEAEYAVEDFRAEFKGLTVELKDGTVITATADSLEKLASIKPSNIKNITMEYTDLQSAIVKTNNALESFDGGFMAGYYAQDGAWGDMLEELSSKTIEEFRTAFNMSEEEATEFFNKVKLLNDNLWTSDGMTSDNSVIQVLNEVAEVAQNKYKELATTVITTFEQAEQAAKDSGKVLSDYLDDIDFWKKHANEVIQSPVHLQELNQTEVLSGNQTEVLSDTGNIETELKLLQDKKEILSSLQKEYDEEEISEMTQIKSYQEILELVTKIRDLKADSTIAKGKISGARQINDSELAKQYENEAGAIRKEINALEDAMPLLVAFEDLTKKTVTSFTTDDELNKFAIELYQTLVNLRGELGLINSEDFSKVSSEINELKESIIKIPDKKKVEIELEYKSMTPDGELAYRGIAGKDGNYLNVSNDDGAVWWTSQKDLSQTRYTRNGTGSEFSGNLKAKNLFEFTSASAQWQKATYLGDGGDELSSKITDLYNKIETLKAKKEELIRTNQIESQEYKDISIELGSLQSQYDAISNSKSNMYGTHMPNDWVKIAKRNGYDGLAIHGIDDDTGNLATSYAVWAKEQIENVKIVAETEEDFIKMHNEFLETASTAPSEKVNQTPLLSSDITSDTTSLDKMEKKLEEVEQQAKETTTALSQVDETNISSGNEIIESQNKIQEELKETQRIAEENADKINSANKNSITGVRSYWEKYGTSNSESYLNNKSDVTYNQIIKQITEQENLAKGIMKQVSKFIDPSNLLQDIDTDYFKAINLELEKLGYHLDEIKINERDHIASAKILPIDDKALTNAEEMLDILKGIKASPIKDTFDVNTESSEMDKVATATDEAVQAKKDFATANEGVQDSVDGSKSKLELEAELMEKLAKSAREAANAKKEFVKANKEVKDSKETSDGKKSNVDKTIDKINSYNKTDSFFGFVKNGNLDSKRYQNISKEIDSIIKKQGKYASSVKATEEEIQKLDDATQTFVDEFEKEFQKKQLALADNLENKIKRITSGKTFDEDNTKIISNIEKNIDKLRDINLFDANDLSTASQVSKLISDINAGINQIKNVSNNPIALLPEPEDINKSIGQINKVLSGGYKIPRKLRTEFEQLRISYKNAFDSNGNVKITNAELQKLENTLSKLNAEFEATGKHKSIMGSLTSRITDMNAKFLAQYFSFQDIVRYGQQGFETIKEYDKALTDMDKVSNESIRTLKEFQKESFGLADAVGTTASQIQNSTSDFLRLGESFEQAKQSAQDANALLKVSEFTDISEATDSLIAMSAAYDELEKSEINDILNYTGNNFSISTSELASALQRSAATLKVAGNDIYEATALVTAGNAVLQDAESVGTGLKMISLRILGTEEAKNELASLGEDVDDFVVQTQSKLDETIRNYTAVASNNFQGVSILDDNGNYKSTYEILKDISLVYQEILETDKKAGTNRGQALLEVLAGKNRSNVAASILQNPELLTSVYEEALTESQGSVQKELDAQLESIESHLNALKNAWDNLWVNEHNREVITSVLDALTDVLHIIDEIGVGWATLFAGVGAFAVNKSIKGEGKRGKTSLFREYALGNIAPCGYIRFLCYPL